MADNVVQMFCDLTAHDFSEECPIPVLVFPADVFFSHDVACLQYHQSWYDVFRSFNKHFTAIRKATHVAVAIDPGAARATSVPLRLSRLKPVDYRGFALATLGSLDPEMKVPEELPRQSRDINEVMTVVGFEGQGVMKSVMIKLLGRLKTEGIKEVYLVCSPDLVPMYQKVHFEVL